MNRVVFAVYPGFELLDVSGPASAFTSANRALQVAGRVRSYDVVLASGEGGLVKSSSGVAVETCAIHQLVSQDIDTLLVSGAEREPLLQAIADARLNEVLPYLTRKARRFGSVCTGVFVLAALGLVDERRVATHWDACGPLAKSFPKVSVDPDVLYVVDGRLWTSAGVTTGIDMVLAMISEDLGPQIAGEVAKRLVLYARRPPYQSQFSPVLRAQAKGDNQFFELIGWIHSNLDAPLDVAGLASRAGLTERTFHRKFVAATGETPARFVEAARLDTARLLLSTGMSLKVVAAHVGLFPATRLAEAFERRFGITPRQFRDQRSDS